MHNRYYRDVVYCSNNVYEHIKCDGYFNLIVSFSHNYYTVEEDY